MSTDHSLSVDSDRFGPNPGKHRDECQWTLHQNTCSCEYPRYLDALDSVVQDYIRAAVENALDNDDPGWGDYPDLPEFVWDDLCERIRRLAGGSHASSEAYSALSALATEEA